MKKLLALFILTSSVTMLHADYYGSPRCSSCPTCPRQGQYQGAPYQGDGQQGYSYQDGRPYQGPVQSQGRYVQQDQQYGVGAGYQDQQYQGQTYGQRYAPSSSYQGQQYGVDSSYQGQTNGQRYAPSSSYQGQQYGVDSSYQGQTYGQRYAPSSSYQGQQYGVDSSYQGQTYGQQYEGNASSQGQMQAPSAQYGSSYDQTQSGAPQQNDQKLAAQIQDSIRKDASNKYNNVNVSVNNGYVTLRGTVANQKDKSALEQKVRGMPGVQSINNQITVQN